MSCASNDRSARKGSGLGLTSAGSSPLTSTAPAVREPTAGSGAVPLSCLGFLRSRQPGIDPRPRKLCRLGNDGDLNCGRYCPLLEGPRAVPDELLRNPVPARLDIRNPEGSVAHEANALEETILVHWEWLDVCRVLAGPRPPLVHRLPFSIPGFFKRSRHPPDVALWSLNTKHDDVSTTNRPLGDHQCWP
jgi:hypothetical protein